MIKMVCCILCLKVMLVNNSRIRSIREISKNTRESLQISERKSKIAGNGVISQQIHYFFY